MVAEASQQPPPEHEFDLHISAWLEANAQHPEAHSTTHAS